MPFRLKRRAAPRSWTIPRKGTKWVLRPAPGPHPQDRALPVLFVLRDLRHLAHSAREARQLVRSNAIRVDNTVVHDLARGVGLMDTVSVDAPVNEHFRMFKDRRGKLVLVPVSASEAKTKIGRVRSKHSVPGGKVQVTLHDGRNLEVKTDSAWHVGDSLKIEVPSQKVLAHLPLGPGQLAYIAGGSHVGQIARVDRVEVRNSPQPNRVHFKEGFATVKEFVYVIGDATPQITLPEGWNR